MSAHPGFAPRQTAVFGNPNGLHEKGLALRARFGPRIECDQGWPHKAPAMRAGEARMAEGEVPIFDSRFFGSEVNLRGEKRAAIRTYPQAAGVK
jgi:hypothetical protein